MSEIKKGESQDLAEVYRNKRHKVVVNTHMFHLKAKMGEPCCFVEGEDSKYYGIRIELITGKDPYFITCGGKQGVLEIYNKIKSKTDYNGYSLFFFVDSDFDEKIDNNEIYETPCYSIENLYTTKESFKKILIREFSLSEEDYDFGKCLQLYDDRFREFHEQIIVLNAWIACINNINKNRESEETIKVNLKDISFKNDIAIVSLDKVIQKKDIHQIESKLNVTEAIEREKIVEQVETFKQKGDYGMTFRGKFELEFFRIFLEKLKEDCNKTGRREIFTNKGRVLLRLEENLLSSLSQYACTPDSLKDYINFIWKREKVAV